LIPKKYAKSVWCSLYKIKTLYVMLTSLRTFNFGPVRHCFARHADERPYWSH